MVQVHYQNYKELVEGRGSNILKVIWVCHSYMYIHIQNILKQYFLYMSTRVLQVW